MATIYHAQLTLFALKFSSVTILLSPIIVNESFNESWNYLMTCVFIGNIQVSGKGNAVLMQKAPEPKQT